MSFKPEFSGPIEGWVVNFLKTNYWRVERTMTRDDVLQEAYIVFMRCAKKYQALEDPKHFMALFKTAWTRQFTTFSNEDTTSRFIVGMASHSSDHSDRQPEPIGDHDNDGYLSVMVKQAPSEVLMVLNLFLNAPQELLDLALGSWRGADRRCKAGGSKRVNQLLGLPEELDVMKMTEDYFREP